MSSIDSARKMKQRYIQLEGWGSIVLNTLLFIIKYWAGVVTGSLALIADAWHTLSDSVSSIFVVIGGRISRKPADKEHPFGHGRVEHITSMVIGVMLAIIAFDFIVQAWEKFQTHEKTVYKTIAWIVTIISILVKEAMAQVAFYMARKTGSTILAADGWHHRTDSLSSVIILAGLIFGQQFWWTDALLSFLVALMIGYASFSILKKEVNSLMGVQPPEKLMDSIIAVAQKASDIPLNLHHIHLHSYGDHVELSCHIKLPPDMYLSEVHEICNNIEKVLLEEFGYIATVHAEPV